MKYSRRKSGFIFDLDGTLLDSRGDILNSLQASFNGNGVRIEFDINDRAIIGPPLDVMVNKLLPNEDKSLREKIIGDFKKHYDQCGFAQTRIYDHVKEVLSYLRDEGALVFVVTNKRENPTRLLLEKFGLNAFFDEVVCSDSTCVHKSKPEMIRGLLDTRRLGGGVVIGDSVSDILAARKNKLLSIGVLYGYEDSESIRESDPDYLAQDANEIKDIVKRIIEEGFFYE